MQPSRGTKLALCAEASTVGFERTMATQPHSAAIPCPATTLDSVLQQRPLRGTWARRSPVSGMPVPVFLHDVERVPSSEFSELLLLADEQLYLFNTPICSNRLLNSGRRL